MRTNTLLLLTTLLIPVIPASAQNNEGGSDSVYRVEFNFHDGSDASATAGRRYVIMATANEKGIFRVGQKVPYATGSSQPAGSTSAAPMVSTQINYADIGVNIECRVNDVGAKVRLKATLDLSSVLQQNKTAASMAPLPVIGQLRADVDGLLTPGKPTMVASIDDPVTSRRMNIEATVTKID